MNIRNRLLAMGMCLGAASAHCEIVDPALAYVGTIKARSTAELRAANITNTFGIGGETTDRGFSNYSNWSSYWAAAGFKDTLLRWKMKPEVVHGEKKDIQPRVQARGGQAGH